MKLLSGRRAFTGDSAIAIVAAILHKEPAALDAPSDLRNIVARCLRKSPADRFQSAAELHAALESATDVPSEPQGTPVAEHVPTGNAAIFAFLEMIALAFAFDSGDPSQEYFAEGMTDELTADLAILSQLRVISRGSATQFKGEHRPPTPEIAKTLNVDAIVEASVLRVGGKVRITAQ